MTPIELFRRSTAKRCANMLYGNHTRKQPISITIPHTLACVPFLSQEDRINLASYACEDLASMLEETYQLLDVTVDLEGENHLRIAGEIKRR